MADDPRLAGRRDDARSRMKAIMKLASLAVILFWTGTAPAQTTRANYDESKVPDYTLPDPLATAAGKPVKDARMWRELRRPELIRSFETNIHGRSSAAPRRSFAELMSSDPNALGGRAVGKQVRVFLTGQKGGPKLDLLLYLPRAAKGRVPVFLGLNFGGNQTVNSDAGIAITGSWVAKSAASDGNRATAKSRGSAASRWPVEHILERGYGVATAYYGDIEPDHKDGFDQSIRKRFLKPGQSRPGPEEWGAIAAWAWGLSRAMDYLVTDRDVDARRVAVHGHSRLGKAALWAGALDTRFALVISNNSGEGGAALSRRKFGEEIRNLNTSFPHWFAANYARFNDREDALPVDMHELVALIAPRPVYVASAAEDQWADPRGEFLSAKAASPVYRLLGQEGIAADQMPAIGQPVMSRIGYHIRAGKHDVTLYDWDRFLDFADKWMR
jgi:hypothetical protein